MLYAIQVRVYCTAQVAFFIDLVFASLYRLRACLHCCLFLTHRIWLNLFASVASLQYSGLEVILEPGVV